MNETQPACVREASSELEGQSAGKSWWFLKIREAIV
jgi:hypothetical protein